MSRQATSFVLGYHGCDHDVGTRALHGDLSLIQSDKEWDWLGPGVYFWESDPDRAREWAEHKVSLGQYAAPFVIGAVIDLRNCLDLLSRENLELLKWSYDNLVAKRNKSGLAMPVNKDRSSGIQRDKLLRFLDCAVIRNLHEIIEDQPDNGYADVGAYIDPFDTVRGLFPEGGEAYPGAGFESLTHTQIAVRNTDCIKGIFVPR